MKASFQRPGTKHCKLCCHHKDMFILLLFLDLTFAPYCKQPSVNILVSKASYRSSKANIFLTFFATFFSLISLISSKPTHQCQTKLHRSRKNLFNIPGGNDRFWGEGLLGYNNNIVLIYIFAQETCNVCPPGPFCKKNRVS